MSERAKETARTPAERLLKIYLNDHLAGSVGLQELVGRCRRENPDGPLGDFLRRLEGELRDDHQVVRGLLERIGGMEDLAKVAVAWLGEKVARLKLNGQLSGYSALSRLEELEGIVLGIRANMALLASLAEAAESEARLRGLDLPTLQERAGRQAAEAEEHRRAAARVAFAP